MVSRLKKRITAACAGVCAGLLLMGGGALLIPKSETVSAVEPLPEAKVYYYVDCGNYVENANGTGDIWWRQNAHIGYPSNQKTGWMTNNGIEFGSAEDHGAGTNVLYNSVTDKPFGTDGLGGEGNATGGTGKEWGFITNDGEYAQWSLGETRNASKGTPTNEVQTGFNTARFQKQANAAGQNFKYKFQVDDNTQPLAIVIGTRRVDEWGGENNVHIKINDVDNGEIKAKMDQDLTYYYTGVGVEENGKYYITLEFGDDQQNELHIAWILIATGNHYVIKNDENKPASTTLGYAQKGSDKVYITPYALDEEEITLTSEQQQTVSAAKNFEEVTLNLQTSGDNAAKQYNFIVIPKDTVYFLNAGDKGDAGIAEPIETYTQEKGAGREEENAALGGETFWGGSRFDQSVIGGKKGTQNEAQGEAIKFKFDLEKGDYAVMIGACGHWRQTRVMEVKIDDTMVGEVSSIREDEPGPDNLTSNATFYTNVAQAEGKQTVNVEIAPRLDQGEGYMISYILIYKVNKITYNTQDGSEVAADYFDCGSSFTVSNDKAPTREGFEFKGWYEEAECTTPANKAYSESKTVYAKWESTTPAPEASIEGVWTNEAEGVTTEVTIKLSDNKETAEAIIYTADKSDPDWPSYTIEHYTYNKTDDGYVYTETGSLTKTYTFTLEGDALTMSISKKMGASDLGTTTTTFTAHTGLPVEAPSFTGEYSADDGWANAVINFDENTMTAGRDSYTFTTKALGKYLIIAAEEYDDILEESTYYTYYIYKDADNYYIIGEDFSEPTELTQQVRAEHTITFKLGAQHVAEGATAPTAITAKEGDLIDLPTNVQAEDGYELTGWREKTGASDFTDHPISRKFQVTGDVELTAVIEAIQYRLTFNKNKPDNAATDPTGMIPPMLTVSVEETTAVLPVLSLDGYIFQGWKRNNEGEAMMSFTLTSEIRAALGGKEISFTAAWEKVAEGSFAIKFERGNIDDSVVNTLTGMPANTSHAAGEYTIPAEEPTCIGYTFKGWKVADDAKIYKHDGENTTYTITDAAVTFTAQWEKVTYTVTYDFGEGTTETKAAEQKAWDTDVEFPATPAAKKGYKFAGWEAKENGEGSALGGRSVNSFTMPMAPVTVYAKWTAISYTVKYASGVTDNTGIEGIPTEDGTISFKAALTLPDDPTRTGYVFAGWTATGIQDPVKKADGQLTLTAEMIPAEGTEITLTATWEKEPDPTYTVSFAVGDHAASGATVPTQQTAVLNGTITLPAAPEAAAGWKFAGWYDGETKAGDANAEYTVTKEVTLTAKWVEDDGDIHEQLQQWGAQGVPATYKITVHNHKSVTVKALFSGGSAEYHGLLLDVNVNNAWYRLRMDPAAFGLNSSSTDTNTWNAPDAMFDNLQIINDGWNQTAYINLYNNGGKAWIVVEATLENNVLTYIVKTYAGTDETLATVVTTTKFILTSTSGIATLDLSFYHDGGTVEKAFASEAALKYTISYQLNDGTNAENAPTEYTFGDGIAELPTPTKLGYTFEGWYTDEAFTAENKVESIGADKAGNITLYAKYTAKNYTIKWTVGDDGTLADGAEAQVTAAYGSDITLPAVTANEGKTFKGWFSGETKIESAAELWALITNNTMTEITLTAQYETVAPAPATYTVTYELGEHAATTATAPTQQTATQEGEYKVTLPAAPEAAEGWKFAGWYDGETKAGDANAEYTVTKDVTLTAKWEAEEQPEPTTFTVTYELGEHAATTATAPTQEPVTSGTEITLAAAPAAAEGWRFAGWQIGSEVKQPNEKITITANTTITAKWEEVQQPEPEKVTVTFNTQEGSTVEAQEIDKGGKATKPATDPTREGYTFKGWYTTADGDTEFDFDTTLDADTTIYAQWTKNEEQPGGGGEEQPGGSEEQPGGSEEQPGETPSEGEEEDDGCGSVISAPAAIVGAAVIITVLGALLIIRKKRSEK